jgi:hypothetical protein
MAAPYRQYEPSLLEPVYPQRTHRLEDLAVELAAKTGNLTRGLHPIIVESLGTTQSRLVPLRGIKNAKINLRSQTKMLDRLRNATTSQCHKINLP